MSRLERDIDDFARFAKSHCAEGVTIDDLYDRWRAEAYRKVDELAVRASLRDMDAGEQGTPFEEFAEEFRKRNDLAS